MILVDTCVIINYLRAPTPEIKKIFQKNEIAICGVVMAELLRGAVSEKQFNQLKSSLECFEYIPFQDAMIALLAMKAACPLWTTDRHFSILQSILPELKLFTP